MKTVYALGRLLRSLLVLAVSMVVLSAAVFAVARSAPGDPLVSYYGERAEKLTAEERYQAEERLGLHQSLPVQYVRWAENALHGDWGISFKYKMPVTEVVAARLGNTLLLGGLGFLLLTVLSAVAALVCAWQEGRFIDRLLCKVGTIVSCVPEFWLSLALILLFSVTLGWLPASGAYSVYGGGVGDRLAHLVLPLTVVVLSHLWYFAYMLRSRLLQEMGEDYALLAQVKGLRRWQVLVRHGLRNALPSYLSLLAVSLPHVLGGTYIVETVFSYPGLGTLAYESARYQDYHLLMVVCLLSGFVVMAANMAAKALSRRLDPRLRGEVAL